MVVLQRTELGRIRLLYFLTIILATTALVSVVSLYSQAGESLHIALILLGIVALSYNRITYTTKEKIVEIGPLQATAEKEKSIPLPPLLGGLALVAGVGLIAVGYKK